MTAGPATDAHLYTTYRIHEDRRVTTLVSCADYDCASWRFGFKLLIDETADLGKLQAAYLRSGKHGMHFEVTYSDGGPTVFTFPAGQRCFAEHRIGTPQLLVQRGNHLQLGPVLRVHTRPDDWVEDMQEQIAATSEVRARG